MYRLYVHLKLNLFHIFLFQKMNNLTLSPPIKLTRFVKKIIIIHVKRHIVYMYIATILSIKLGQHFNYSIHIKAEKRFGHKLQVK